MYNFTLNEKEAYIYFDWVGDHECKFSKYSNNIGAIGGQFTFSFTPNNIGCSVTIKCACGEVKDITDYTCW